MNINGKLGAFLVKKTNIVVRTTTPLLFLPQQRFTVYILGIRHGQILG